MDLKSALSQLRNICINTGNMHVYDSVKDVLDSSEAGEVDLAAKVAELVEHIREKSSYSGMEASNIMKNFGAELVRITENSPAQIVFICKINRRTYTVKILHPTSRYVLSQGPWKVIPTVYTDSAQKEAKKIQESLLKNFPYKKVEIEAEKYVVV